jgi:hypothetical protein
LSRQFNDTMTALLIAYADWNKQPKVSSSKYVSDHEICYNIIFSLPKLIYVQ